MEEFGVPWPPLNDGYNYEELVKYKGKEDPQTLLDYYASRYESSAPREGWRQRIQRGQIIISGNVVTDPDFVVGNGTVLVYNRLPWEEPDAPYRLQILYEDEYLLAINKPSGLQVQAGGYFQQRTAVQQLVWRYQPGRAASPVHRLGRGTSGVLLCAKSAEVASALSKELAAGTESGINTERSMSKIYRTLVCGIVQEDEIVIDQPIGRAQYPGVRCGLYMANQKGKPALSKVKVLQRKIQDNTTIVEVKIYTGRAHQIRIHLATIGHPLWGDPLYVSGGQPSPAALNQEGSMNTDDGGHERPTHALPGDCGYHLHAHKLSFDHPVTGKKMEIEAPLPPILIA